MNTSRLVFAGVWLGPLIIASPLLATLISLDNSVPLVVNVKEIPDNPPAPTVDRKALTVKLAKALDKIQASALAAKSSNDLTDLFEQVREWQR
ncbi:MAG: hypothetical protein LBK76_05960, partial [Verrucomicrobiales bacterium]|nr:hypothetical protein [Verrucomicrobiales bacterium]